MYSVHIEMPSGAVSRGYERKELEPAEKIFTSLVAQMKPWLNFSAEVFIMEDETELQREKINNAA